MLKKDYWKEFAYISPAAFSASSTPSYNFNGGVSPLSLDAFLRVDMRLDKFPTRSLVFWHTISSPENNVVRFYNDVMSCWIPSIHPLPSDLLPGNNIASIPIALIVSAVF